MAIDDQRPAWGPVEPQGEQAPGAASIFAADPPGLGRADAAAPPEEAPAPWAPIMATEPAPQPVAEPAPQPAAPFAPSVAPEPWAPIMATEPAATPAPEPAPATPAEELLPSPRGFVGDEAAAWTPPVFAPAPSPAPADPVWQLGAAAVEAANLQAAGAPVSPAAPQPSDASQGSWTPPADAPAPVAPAPTEPGPRFEAEQAFVPRFDPIGGVTPAASPSLSFTEPAPRQADPYSGVVVPASDEPAYVPVVDLSQADRTHVVEAGPLEDVAAPALSDEPAPALTTRRSFLAPAEPAPTEAVRQPEPVQAPSASPYEQDALEADSYQPAYEATPSPEPLAAFQQPSYEAPTFEQPSYEQPAYAAPTFEQPTYEQPTYEQPTYEQQAPQEPLAEHWGHGAPTEPLAVAATEPEAPTTRLPWASVGATEALPAVPAAATAGAAFPSAAAPFEAIAPAAASDARETLIMPLAGDPAAKGKRRGKPASTTGGLPVTARDQAPRKPLRIVLIALGAVVVAAGLGYGVFRLFFWPDPVILPVPTITAAIPTPSGEPIAVTDASDFGASIPDTVGTDVLMEYTSTDPLGDDTLPARAAEHLTLAYGSGAGTPTFTVEAYQHYQVEEAEAAYDAYADGKPDRADVEVDGQVVGERAWATEGDAGTVVWRNGTAVFVVTGPADEVLHFFEHFGV